MSGTSPFLWGFDDWPKRWDADTKAGSFTPGISGREDLAPTVRRGSRGFPRRTWYEKGYLRMHIHRGHGLGGKFGQANVLNLGLVAQPLHR